MLVEDVMKNDVITLTPADPISKALNLLNLHHIRHIPIVDKNHHVVGIVSDRDVRDASPSIFHKTSNPKELENEIRSIMTSPVVTVHPLDFVEEIAAIFYEKEFACVPVVQNKKLVGIVTERDMLYTLIQLTGTHVQSSQIEIKVPDRIGILPEVMSILGKRNVNITSVLIYPYKNEPKYKTLVLRIQTMNPLPIINDLMTSEFELIWPRDMGNSI